MDKFEKSYRSSGNDRYRGEKPRRGDKSRGGDKSREKRTADVMNDPTFTSNRPVEHDPQATYGDNRQFTNYQPAEYNLQVTYGGYLTQPDQTNWASTSMPHVNEGTYSGFQTGQAVDKAKIDEDYTKSLRELQARSNSEQKALSDSYLQDLDKNYRVDKVGGWNRYDQYKWDSAQSMDRIRKELQTLNRPFQCYENLNDERVLPPLTEYPLPPIYENGHLRSAATVPPNTSNLLSPGH